MNIKQLVLKVSDETKLPASEVRKVVNAALDVLRLNVETGENFTSTQFNVKAITLKPSEKVDDQGVKTIIPERKAGRLILKELKIND
jgi:hypothetical protein